MSKKILLGILVVLALAVAFVATVPTFANGYYAAEQYQVITGSLVCPCGEPMANERIIAVIWNETGNCAMAYFDGYTDENGEFNYTVLQEGGVIPEDTSGSEYNATILIYKYGRWMLLNWSKDLDPDGIDWDTLKNGYLNATIVAGHWHALNFTAMTDLEGDGIFETPLFFEDPENSDKEDIAHFKIYWNDTMELIWEVDAFGGEDYAHRSVAKQLFNISDTEVKFSESGLAGCYVIEEVKNVTLYKETYWKLYKNPGETLDVLVGKDLLEWIYVLPNGGDGSVSLNVTDLVSEKEETVADYPYTDYITVCPWNVTNHAYTFVAAVDLLDACGDELDTGEIAVWKVFWQAKLDNMNVILRSGKPVPRDDWVPSRGFDFNGYTVFWLPNITALYGVNVTLNVEYYEVMVFTASINTSDLAADKWWVDEVGAYMNHTVNYDEESIGPGLHKFFAATSVVKTRIVVKDSEPTSQPLIGAIVTLYHAWGDPIHTITDVDGTVALPPFEVLHAGQTSEGTPLISYDSVYWDSEGDYGYLPTPFSFRNRPDMLYNYTLTIQWALPGSDKWVDVTIAENATISLNVSAYWRWCTYNGVPGLAYFEPERGSWTACECDMQEFTVFTNVYEAKFRFIDLCDQPITAEDFPGATAIIWIKVGDEWVTSTGIPVGIGADGTVDLGQVPASQYRIRLWFKGVEMRANMTESPDEEPIVNVTENIWKAVTLRFPIGQLNITATMWDAPAPLAKLNVTLEYLKDGNVVWKEDWRVTDCNGTVTFDKVPLAPVEDTPHNYSVRVRIYTSNETPYIRHHEYGSTFSGGEYEDANLLVADKTFSLGELELVCSQTKTIPTWIFSFTLLAVDHEGNVLETFKTDIGDYPVTVVLDDQAYYQETEECPFVPECVCYYNITVDYRIVNMTGPTDATWGFTRNGKDEAVFAFTSVQYKEDDTFTPKNYPHLFVAGATYHFRVFHGGVLVYNYTITLPRPDKTVTVFFNESDGTVTTVEGWSTLNYTWTDDNVAHPILRFTGSKSYLEGGERYDSKLELVTWTQTLDVYTLSNAGDYLAPKLNLTLLRLDVLNWTTVCTDQPNYTWFYNNVTGEAWRTWTNYAWNSVDEDGDGKITIQIPVWLPNRAGQSWLLDTFTWSLTVDMDHNKASWKSNAVKFGAYIADAFVLAGSDWGSVNVPDTPFTYDWTSENTYLESISHELYGYVVNWNHTTPSVFVSPVDRRFYADWWKAHENGTMLNFYGNDTTFYGDDWNMTYWSGAAKVVHTLAMDGFCVTVSGPDLRDNLVPLVNQPVKVTALGYETGTVQLNDIVKTDANGEADFEPTTAGTTTLPSGDTKPVAGDPLAYKFDVPGFDTSSFAYLSYSIETWQNFEELLEPYGLKPEDVLDLDILSVTVVFSEDNNNAEECVPLTWDALKFTVEDWSGKPLKNAMVAALLRLPRAKAIPSVFGFTAENGTVILYVPSGNYSYEIKIFWRDSYLLYNAGKIPKSIDIYDSVADESIPRLYSPGQGATIQTYVYVGLIKLFNNEGNALSTDALSKLTVTITWPDKVVTTHKPESDGTVKIILNKDVNPQWPDPVSAKYSPDSPHPQSPPGEYHVVVEWQGVGKLAEKTFRIHKARTETPEIVFNVNLNVVDMKVTIKTPFDTPMAGASVVVTKPDGTTVNANIETDGTIFVPEVPTGTLKVKVTNWNGLPVNFEGTVTVDNPVLVVNTIGKLTVKVLGSRGQGLAGASVVIQGTPITAETDASGAFTVELPAGTYTVTANKGGKTGTASATVNGGATSEVTIKLDVFMTIAGWELSTGEFAGLLLLVALMVIVLFIIAHEYAAWRRRRLARAVVPAKTE
ncbi:MAG: carboxypeptidase regulatory-like domain-containing protein [Thermoproteales archaeon]|nr:carboxypeptidase regulatory-like domain-containing protein [Thermoproteales archaeon]